MTEIDRLALILKPSKKFIEWLASITNEENMVDEHFGQDPTVILVPSFESDEELSEYIHDNCRKWMEYEFASWCMNDSDWPEERDIDSFQDYFEISVHSLVIDNELDEFANMENTTLQ